MNVLLVLTDQLRADWIGTNPNVPVRTPHLASLAERGVQFTNAICPSPLCGPSRACLASGLEYPANWVTGNVDYPLDQPTYYGRLRDEAGYEVIGVGDLDLHMDSPTWGLDGQYMLDALGFSGGVEIPGKFQMVATYANDLSGHSRYEEGGSTVVSVGSAETLPPNVDPAPGEPANAYMTSLEQRGLLEAYVEDIRDRDHFETTRPCPLPQDAYVDDWVGQRAVEHLTSIPEDRPWHLAVNFVGPHPPLDVTEEMHGWYRDPDVPFPAPVDPAGDLDPEHHQEIRRNYAAMIENIDRWLGRLLDVIEDRDEREETIVVFTSDHGELLGDHGAWEKKSPRRESVAVPLVVAGPGVESGREFEGPTTTLDLHATVLDYADVDPASIDESGHDGHAVSPDDVDSQSLRPVLEGRTDRHRQVVRSGLDPWRLVFDGRFALVTGFDRDRDPAISRSLANWFAEAHANDREVARRELQQSADPLLFDHEQAPADRRNVANEFPEVVDRLSSHLPAR